MSRSNNCRAWCPDEMQQQVFSYYCRRAFSGVLVTDYTQRKRCTAVPSQHCTGRQGSLSAFREGGGGGEVEVRTAAGTCAASVTLFWDLSRLRILEIRPKVQGVRFSVLFSCGSGLHWQIAPPARSPSSHRRCQPMYDHVLALDKAV